MRQCALLRARWSFLGGKKTETETSEIPNKLTVDKPVESETAAEQEVEFHQPIDKYRARGFLAHNKSYKPPANLEEKLSQIVNECTPLDKMKNVSDWRQLSIGDDVNLKFQILTRVEKNFGKRMLNSYLHEMKTMNDVLKYYQIGASLVAPYNQMARNAENLPPNVHFTEECIRYDPERDGPTAFPKMDNTQVDPRDKVLYKGYKAKREWHEFQEKHVRHDMEPDDAPWSSSMSDRLDTVSTKSWFKKRAGSFFS